MSYETNTAAPYALFALNNNNNNDDNDEGITNTSNFSNNVQVRGGSISQNGNTNNGNNITRLQMNSHSGHINHASYGLANMTSPVIFVTHLLQ